MPDDNGRLNPDSTLRPSAAVAIGHANPPNARRTGVGARSSRLADSRRLAARAAACNAQLDNLTDLQALLSDQPGLRATVTTADVHRQRLVRQHLRKVFDDVAAGQEQQVVQRLNTLLARYRVRPTITGTSPADWHISLAAPGTPSSVAYLAATVWGLAVWLCQRGIDARRVRRAALPHSVPRSRQ